jgi:hypothetical protein
MTLETKAAGKFDREAERQVQPPGYAYIASPSEGKNRYGYWENRNGSSFWVFYGRYALMRDLFWGHGNSGWLNERSYRDFDNHRRSGRVYYDKSTTGGQRFGKGGTFTNSRYSGSEYVRSGGYREFRERAQRRSTRYSGSRYSSRSTRSSPRSTSFGSSRGRSFGGSRFGGGK